MPIVATVDLHVTINTLMAGWFLGLSFAMQADM